MVPVKKKGIFVFFLCTLILSIGLLSSHQVHGGTEGDGFFKSLFDGITGKHSSNLNNKKPHYHVSGIIWGNNNHSIFELNTSSHTTTRDIRNFGSGDSVYLNLTSGVYYAEGKNEIEDVFVTGGSKPTYVPDYSLNLSHNFSSHGSLTRVKPQGFIYKVNTTWYQDSDGDGYHSENIVVNDTSPSPASNWSMFKNHSVTDCDDSNSSLNPDTVWVNDSNNDGYKDAGTSTKTQCNSPGNDWILQSNSKPIEFSWENSSFYWKDLNGNKLSGFDKSGLPRVVDLVANYSGPLSSNGRVSMEIYENLSSGRNSGKRHLYTISSSDTTLRSSSSERFIANASFKLTNRFLQGESSFPKELYFESSYSSGLFSNDITNSSKTLKITNNSKSCDFSSLDSSNFIRISSCSVDDYANYSLIDSDCSDVLGVPDQGVPGDCDYNNLGVIGGLDSLGEFKDSEYSFIEIGKEGFFASKNYTSVGGVKSVSIGYNRSIAGNETNFTLSFDHNFSKQDLNLRRISSDLIQESFYLSGNSGPKQNRSKSYISYENGSFLHSSLSIDFNISNYSITFPVLNDSGKLCLNENPVDSDDLSPDCSDKGEVLLECPGHKSGHNCTYIDNKSAYSIDSLSHSSLVGESVDVRSKSSSNGGDGGSGGGSGGGFGGGVGSKSECTREDWSCFPPDWSGLSCSNGTKERNCMKDLASECHGGFEPNETKKCSSVDNGEPSEKPYVNEKIPSPSESEGRPKEESFASNFPWMIVLASLAAVAVGLIVAIVLLNNKEESLEGLSSEEKLEIYRKRGRK